MQNLNTQLNILEQKIERLLSNMNRIKGENKDLLTENNRLKKELQEVNTKQSNLDFGDGMNNSGNGEELLRIKNELNQYIEEVEHCINMLES